MNFSYDVFNAKDDINGKYTFQKTDPNGNHIDYMERRSDEQSDIAKEFTLLDYPK